MASRNLLAFMTSGTAALMASITIPVSSHVTFEWATIGNPGNAAAPLNGAGVPGVGSVAHEYRSAKHEVTNWPYAEFSNAVAATDTNALYSTVMGVQRMRRDHARRICRQLHVRRED